jgi:hypothetical protein
MKIQQLGIEEMARHGATHRVNIKAEDLNGVGTGFGALTATLAAAVTGTVTPFGALAAGVQVSFIQGYLKTQFVGAAISALTLTLGYALASGTSKAAGCLAATSVLAAATPITFLAPELDDATDAATALATVNLEIKTRRKVFGVVATPGALFTATGANLSALTAGEVHLYFRLVDLTLV